ncbi:hypothetical protein JTB14_018318 [Gonioctena quinquepunctata]|nr:hypothetical protein JTB14_018318 [Gonioctena quinquepunctata]
METCKLFVILVSYCVCSASSYPSRPLNERSPDLTWEAWLLVDDQNQNKQLVNADGMLRRRITPKSIFVAPTFSPESLPPCADGYSSDMLGRCVKIIKLDQDAHYEFLIQKLKEKFSPSDYDYEEEEISTAGPLQVNIPLDMEDMEDSEEETDIAIIVSPTKTARLNLDKRDSVYDENKQELDLKHIAEISLDKHSLKTQVTLEETTTTTEESTTVSTLGSTTEEEVDPQSSTVFMVDIEEEPTADVGKTTSATTENPLTITTDVNTATETTSSPKPEVTSNSNLVRFPDDAKVLPYHQVTFPDGDGTFRALLPSSGTHIVSSRESSIEDNLHNSSGQSDDPVVFREVDYNAGRQITATTTQRIFNRRNRDRHNGLFFPRWSQSSFQKPVVLRFSRKNAFLNTNQFGNQEYYRSIPTDDLAYLFKFKHKQANQE